MTYDDALKHLEQYIYTMNGEYISEDAIPSKAKQLLDSIYSDLGIDDIILELWKKRGEK
jgi:hypothetical protein